MTLSWLVSLDCHGIRHRTCEITYSSRSFLPYRRDLCFDLLSRHSIVPSAKRVALHRFHSRNRAGGANALERFLERFFGDGR